MTTNTDFEDAKGRAKEAVGDLTDDEELQREGETDQASADVKRRIDDATERLKDGVDAVKDKLSN